MSAETVFRVAISASDRAELLAALSVRKVHPTGTPETPPPSASQGAVSVEAYVTQGQIDALSASGVTVDVIEDASAFGLARQQEVGTGNRFEGNVLPQGLGQLIADDDVVS